MSAGQSRQDFENRVGEIFEIGIGGQTVALRLASVRSLGDGLREGGAFALSFEGPADPILAQATYNVVNGSMDAVDMFIVPVGSNAAGHLIYEAIYT